MVTQHNGTYKLSIYCDETVPPFGPTLPNPPLFQVGKNDENINEMNINLQARNSISISKHSHTQLDQLLKSCWLIIFVENKNVKNIFDITSYVIHKPVNPVIQGKEKIIFQFVSNFFHQLSVRIFHQNCMTTYQIECIYVCRISSFR